jgi:hypothetical protein
MQRGFVDVGASAFPYLTWNTLMSPLRDPMRRTRSRNSFVMSLVRNPVAWHSNTTYQARAHVFPFVDGFPPTNRDGDLRGIRYIPEHII